MAKPEATFKGGGCNASVFENQITRNGKTVTLKKVSFQKRYKDSDGQWKSTASLDVNDIPKAILVLSETYRYLVLQDGGNSGSAELI